MCTVQLYKYRLQIAQQTQKKLNNVDLILNLCGLEAI